MNLTQVLAILKAISDEFNVVAAEETIRGALAVPHTLATIIGAVVANAVSIFPDSATRPTIINSLNGAVALWNYLHPSPVTLAAVFPEKCADLA